MKNLTRHILTAMLICSVMALTGCSAVKRAAVDKIKQIRITSFKVDKVTPQGLKAVDATFYVGIYNPTIKLELSNVQAHLFYHDKEVGSFMLDPFTIESHDDRIYYLSGHAALVSSKALFQVISAFGGKPEDYTVLISATGKALGIKRDISDVFPLVELLGKH